MRNNKAPKVVFKIGMPIFTILAGILLILKVIGVANISWWLILAVWLAPLCVILAILAVMFSIIIVVGIIAGLVFAFCFVGDWIMTKFSKD